MKGEIVTILLAPIGGPRCSIQTADGLLLSGVRVPDDYVREGESEAVYRGRCVRFRGVDSVTGTVVFDGNGKSLATFEGPARWEVREVEPPELRGPVRRGEYLPHQDRITTWIDVPVEVPADRFTPRVAA